MVNKSCFVILNLGTQHRWAVNFKPQLLYLHQRTLVPTEKNLLPPTGFVPKTAQPMAIQYTYYAVPAPYIIVMIHIRGPARILST